MTFKLNQVMKEGGKRQLYFIKSKDTFGKNMKRQAKLGKFCKPLKLKDWYLSCIKNS